MKINQSFFKHIKLLVFVGSIIITNNSCNQSTNTNTTQHQADMVDTISCPPNSKLDTSVIVQLTGMNGVSKNGEYKITVPQNDLNVVVDGFKIIPAMGLGSWAAFTPCGDSAMVMGDVVLTEKDLAPVQQEVVKQGFAITAIHNHFVRNTPDIMYMHIDGKGNVTHLATSLKAIFDRVKQSRGGDPKAAKGDSVVNTLDIKTLDSIIGARGEMNKGVYKYTIGRPDVALREHSIPVSSFMGFNTWAAFQGSSDMAAVAGDFTMLEHEVTPVIKALVENGIEVVAVHNHMVHEEPRIFFLHYWGKGNAEHLANGLKQALNQTGKEKVDSNKAHS